MLSLRGSLKWDFRAALPALVLWQRLALNKYISLMFKKQNKTKQSNKKLFYDHDDGGGGDEEDLKTRVIHSRHRECKSRALSCLC